MCKRLIAAFFAAAALVGCSKNHVGQPSDKEHAGGLEITVNVPVNRTKVSEQSDDARINNLQVLLFDSRGVLEAYKQGTGSSLTLTCTSGEKKIAVFANAASMASVGHYSQIAETVSDLSDNSVSGLVMEGYKTVTLNASGTVDVLLRRLAARISIKSVKNSFELEQHQGMPFEITSIYLVNVAGEQFYMDDTDSAVPDLWYNKMACTQELSFLYDELASGSTLAYGDEYDTEHYFYAYPNPVSTDMNGGEEWSERKTRLVVEASLDGETYYYPITLDNVAQNTSYSYTLEITRPGSSSPDIPVDDSAVTFNVSVDPWNELPVVSEVI